MRGRAIASVLAAAAVGVAPLAMAGEVSVGVATTTGNVPSDVGRAVDLRWRLSDRPWSAYAEVLGEPHHFAAASVGVVRRLAWRRLYFEPGIGVGLHAGDGRKAFGTLVLFHLSGTLSVHLSDHVALELGVEHWSNARMAMPDHGFNAVVARVAVHY